MRGILFSLLFVGLVGWGMPSAADSPTDVLSGCLVDSLNGKERKAFAKSVFFAMAAHPEISEFSKVKKRHILKSDKALGAIFTRLLSEDCPNELKTCLLYTSDAADE